MFPAEFLPPDIPCGNCFLVGLFLKFTSVVQDKSSIVSGALVSSSVFNVNFCFPRLLITSTFNLLKKVDLRFENLLLIYI